MFCPECKAEYRQGFTHCADCDVDLVYALETKVGDGFRVIWRGVDQQSCVSVCYQLQELGITYKVTEIRGSLGPDMRVPRRYELAVSPEDCGRAKAVLGITEDPPTTLSEAEWQEMEEPEEPPDLQEAEDRAHERARDLGPATGSSSADGQARRDAYLNSWYPEDATVEIWSQGDADISASIEAALKENLIHCRVDHHNGIRRVLVTPQDADDSRHIVREIIAGGPME